MINKTRKLRIPLRRVRATIVVVEKQISITHSVFVFVALGIQ